MSRAHSHRPNHHLPVIAVLDDEGASRPQQTFTYLVCQFLAGNHDNWSSIHNLPQTIMIVINSRHTVPSNGRDVESTPHWLALHLLIMIIDMSLMNPTTAAECDKHRPIIAQLAWLTF
ncbi:MULTISPECIES: hypothetical protein [unclassified Mycolicibacterium]|uniref:hypothetical protein n=1 Tax=unclassified Mycolicibacterium TaxID=2636767 RepID=UPI002ED93D43